MDFGYLPKTDNEIGNLRTEDQMISAIKSMQKFYSIPQSGVIDKKTIELMQRPRCGLPDNPPADYSAKNRDLNRSNRFKRYTVHNSKWDHTNLTWR